ncbi:hypothetical protein TNIN_468021 [Trichonephila inaurata madagascariensis]|uniref:Uncharacterized protein n=1 Tax=Trichonephila inaurata madagascariensis TaxID=2747483 RepID=A0A8X6XH13_9ARAC|nr:hypothetical protein TNIN_468021 [Trichonephila inaurata madagascariensis]
MTTIRYVLCYGIVTKNDSQQSSSGIAEYNSFCKFFQVELQLGQSCSNRSNFTFKRSTWAYSDVERKEFGENFGTCVRAIRQDGSNGKDPKPLWFRVCLFNVGIKKGSHIVVFLTGCLLLK